MSLSKSVSVSLSISVSISSVYICECHSAYICSLLCSLFVQELDDSVEEQDQSQDALVRTSSTTNTNISTRAVSRGSPGVAGSNSEDEDDPGERQK